MNLDNFETLKEKANKRFNEFEIKQVDTNLIENIDSEAYIRKSIWI
jgi:hypothetical protein